MLKSYFNHMFDKVMEDGLLSVHPMANLRCFTPAY